MKRVVLAVTLLAALGAACAKAGREASEARSAVGVSDGVMKAAMAEAEITNFTGITVVGISDGLMKAAMLDAGITNFSGTTPSEGELPSGAPHPRGQFGGQS